jgi:hypothetical protein
MNTRPTALILLALALAACGSNPPKAADAGEGKRIEGVVLSAGVKDIAKEEGKVDLAKDKRVNCEKYTPTGSNRPKYRCLTASEKQSEAEANQRQMRKMTTPAPSAAGVGN